MGDYYFVVLNLNNEYVPKKYNKIKIINNFNNPNIDFNNLTSNIECIYVEKIINQQYNINFNNLPITVNTIIINYPIYNIALPLTVKNYIITGNINYNYEKYLPLTITRLSVNFNTNFRALNIKFPKNIIELELFDNYKTYKIIKYNDGYIIKTCEYNSIYIYQNIQHNILYEVAINNNLLNEFILLNQTFTIKNLCYLMDEDMTHKLLKLYFNNNYDINKIHKYELTYDRLICIFNCLNIDPFNYYNHKKEKITKTMYEEINKLKPFNFVGKVIGNELRNYFQKKTFFYR